MSNSKMWNFFKKSKLINKVECVLCGILIKKNSNSTSSLHSHMKNYHKDEYQNCVEEKNVTEILNISQQQFFKPTVEEITSNLCCVDNISFNSLVKSKYIHYI